MGHLKYSARIVYTLFLVSFSLFQAAILHHVVLFFFYQIIPGLLSASMRILKGMLLRVIFFSRIDRTSLVQGFQAWDKGT